MELRSEREESEKRLSGSPPPPPPSGGAEYWDVIGGIGGASLACNGTSSDVDFLARFLTDCPLFKLGSAGLAAVGERRKRPVRLMREDFFCSGPISMVGAVVMMLGAVRRQVSWGR